MQEQLKQYREVLPFLHDRNPNARNVALANLLPLTATNSPFRTLFFSGINSGGLKAYSEPEVIRDLKLLCRDQPATAHDAFRALVNLSDSSLISPSLSEPLFLTFLVAYILHPSSILSDLACMLLSNITAQPGVCKSLLDLKVDIIAKDGEAMKDFYPVQSRCVTSPPPTPYPEGPTRQERALPLLVEVFATSGTTDGGKSERKGKLHFLASVFANISTLPEGRHFFLSSRQTTGHSEGSHEAPLASLLPFTEYPDTIRRGGVVSTIKNCSFVQEAHKLLMSPEEELFTLSFSSKPVAGLNILPSILLPLAGPEEFELEDVELLLPALQFLPSTKKREVDPVLRLAHLETLLLLCTTRWGRDVQRRSGVYEIVRTMHETEEDEKVISHIERLVNMLKRDEAPEGQEEQAEPKGNGTTGPKVGQTPHAEESDEDDKIVEI